MDDPNFMNEEEVSKSPNIFLTPFLPSEFLLVNAFIILII